MTTERIPPPKVQCIRSGRIFLREQMSLIGDEPRDLDACPACGQRVQGTYTPCTTFQNVDVDVT